MSDALVDSDVTKLAFLEGGFVDLDELTISEANDAVDFTCAAAKGYTLAPVASNRLDQQSVCDTGPKERFTQENYEAQFDLYNEGDPTATEENSVFLTARALFSERGVKGDIIRRISPTKGARDAFAIGDEIDVFGVELDHPRDLSGQDGDASQMTVLEFAPKARMRLRAEIVDDPE